MLTIDTNIFFMFQEQDKSGQRQPRIWFSQGSWSTSLKRDLEAVAACQVIFSQINHALTAALTHYV